MSSPNQKVVDEALNAIERASTHPRVLARAAVAGFRERDAQSDPQPWIQARTGSGAPLLDIDSTLSKSEPQHAPRLKVKRRRGWWRR